LGFRYVGDEATMCATILDSRELEDELVALTEDVGDEGARLDALQFLKSELDGSGWEYGIQLIPEGEFEDYARQLAEDIGAIPENGAWPTYCIDWERAARELAMDYSTVEFEGITYYWREA
jgi:antirestriction protein